MGDNVPIEPEQYDDYEDEEPYYDLSAILRSYGYGSIDDLTRDIVDLSEKDIRGTPFISAEDAIIFLNELGVLGFAHIFQQDDIWFVEIGDSPGGTK